jgi:pSer/pThr/pTyr-binding forkhead associated (FHA) protein
VIGSGAGCDVRVADPYVSARHAQVVVDEQDAVWITDLGSTNGTYIQRAGGRLRVQVHAPTRLYPGDVLWLGARTSIPWTA